jgi:ribonuclease BN (tRNA processing enzyme)
MPSVRVRFLGSGDAFGSGGRFQTCILVESEDLRCLVDCGASSLIAMKHAGVDPGEIDLVLVTHLHGDHFGGIPFLVLDGQFSRRARTLKLAGPPGLRTRVTNAMEVLFPGSSDAKRTFGTEFLELPESSPTRIGPLTVTPFEVIHASGAPPYALRLELDGRVIAYSGDTEWTDQLLSAAAGADLFICEAYVYEKPVRFHLDYQTLMRHRGELGCKRLVVTHMSSDMLSPRSALAVESAEDGLEIAL